MWEYNIIDNASDIQLNRAGREGWELVAVVAIPGFTENAAMNIKAFLKRPVFDKRYIPAV